MRSVMLTVREVCGQLALAKPDSILAAIRSGELIATNISSGPGRATWRIDPADLETFLANRRAVPAVKNVKTPRRHKLENVIEFF